MAELGAIGALLLFALGLIVGSFLNVCIYRLPRGESLVWPRSRCPHCGHPLRWVENVPILSYLLQRGRCTACGVPISLVYPLVEAATATLFLAAHWHLGWQGLLVPRLVLLALLVALFVIDLQHRLLPNALTLPGMAVGLLFSLFFPPGWRAALVGVLVGGGLLFAVGELYLRVRGEEGLGMGDVKMLAMIGAFLGWRQVLVTLVLASLAGSLLGLALIVAGRGTMKYPLPFGSFLAAGAVVAALAGERLVAWYASFYP